MFSILYSVILHLFPLFKPSFEEEIIHFPQDNTLGLISVFAS